ncbi:RNA ligase family protein [Ectobacillus polymachus]|uniref:ATP-dependent DNA ligase n=1 Tax=Ectobacillus polymachus TaxID=1508806 RepID=UPI003A8A6F9E
MNIKPIIPFEPTISSHIPDSAEWISQIKWDGVRILTYYNRNELRLFNRKCRERTQHFPELHALQTSASSLILDGEVIALDEKERPSFHEVMRRDAIRRMDRIPQMTHTVPVYYMVFDILFVNEKWVHALPYKERMDLLRKYIEPTPTIQLVPSYNNGHALFDVVKQHGMEGIVSKNVNSPYVINGKNDNWRKIKNYKDIIAVIGGVIYRSGIVNSVLVGMYDEKSDLVYIGHVGAGKLTNKDWHTLTRLIEPLITSTSPFPHGAEIRKDTVWVVPKLTVKIQYLEWKNSLRQPSIQAFIDVPPKSCILPHKEDR